MDRSASELSSRGHALEITLLQGRPKRALKRRERAGFSRSAVLIYGLDGPARRAVALRYLEDVIAPRAIAFCHRLARRLARYR